MQAMFPGIRQAGWRTLGLFVALHGAFKLLFFSAFFVRHASVVYFATGGLITETFLTYLLELAVLVGGVAFWAGGLRPKDVGMIAADLLNAGIIVLLLWGTVQLALLLVEAAGTGWLRPNPAFEGPALSALVGKGIEAACGSALFEEIMYRGLLLPQLYLVMENRWAASTNRCIAGAVLASQLYFGLNHIPAGVVMGLSAPLLLGYVAQVTFVGVFFAAIFLRTGNLFVAVGVHALLNQPMPLFASEVDASLLTLICASALLILWPVLARVFDEVFTLRPALAAG